jgi:hypothetical protein
MRDNIHTGFRVLCCGFCLWALQLGSYTVPINFGSALLVAAVIGMLLVYELAIRDVTPGVLILVLASVLGSIMGAFAVWHALQPPPPTGPLRPAGEPSPKLTCPQKADPGDLVIYFGTDARIGQGNGPFTAFKMADCPVLSFTRTKAGLNFSDVAYDYDGDIAFMIRNGVYEPQFPLELHALRPDPSTYILLDHYDQEVIYIRYLNPNAVRVRGRFICGEAPQVVVRDSGILLGGIRVAGITTGQHAAPGHACLKAGPEPRPKPYLRSMSAGG